MKTDENIKDTIECIQSYNLLINMMRTDSNGIKVVIEKQEELISLLNKLQLKQDRKNKLSKLK